jgi:hypothetical protein
VHIVLQPNARVLVYDVRKRCDLSARDQARYCSRGYIYIYIYTYIYIYVNVYYRERVSRYFHYMPQNRINTLSEYYYINHLLLNGQQHQMPYRALVLVFVSPAAVAVAVAVAG